MKSRASPPVGDALHHHRSLIDRRMQAGGDLGVGALGIAAPGPARATARGCRRLRCPTRRAAPSARCSRPAPACAAPHRRVARFCGAPRPPRARRARTSDWRSRSVPHAAIGQRREAARDIETAVPARPHHDAAGRVTVEGGRVGAAARRSAAAGTPRRPTRTGRTARRSGSARRRFRTSRTTPPPMPARRLLERARDLRQGRLQIGGGGNGQPAACAWVETPRPGTSASASTTMRRGRRGFAIDADTHDSRL